jgi:predicted negative regulator of RcsB-dependent stress response
MKKSKGIMWIIVLAIAAYFGYNYFIGGKPSDVISTSVDTTTVVNAPDTAHVALADTTKKDTTKTK